jgi:hypothetical protein
MYKIVISDNNISLLENFKDVAFNLNIEAIVFTDWESAQAHIESEGVENFTGLILDGKGWVNNDEQIETSMHVNEAVKWLNEQKGLGNILPTIIYTAYLDNIKEFSKKDDIVIEILDKKNSCETVLQKLLLHQKQNPTSRIKYKYKDVFSVFNDIYLSKKTSNNMIDLLSKLDEPIVDKNNFNTIRDIIEEMLKSASHIDNINFLPTVLLKPAQGGRPNLKFCELYLSGREVDLSKGGGTGTLKALNQIMPAHVSRIFTSLTEVSSILSHTYSNQLTNYAYKNAVFGLCEVLLWFKDYTNKTYHI